ncbi:Ras guanine nucleotide exchange factor [Tieghemostelium lacteum]|uniref:Ras guanine nucleotide exchange factor n=1 Tax=Tieghemostelium lacteum TaxID=361077 RepID=A0A151ZJ15_TIELA|nr:Ras guanine nucleotide exchange factor [Tieghemostelium lacteum]|eukprot:KYQ93963.1 Ras guanine nucleotide exchange factor [Tieghemostelium lacteum]
MAEVSLIGVTAVLCEKENSIWRNIDDSLCRLEILKSEKDSKYRLVAITTDNRCIINKWVRTNSFITKCSDVFLEIKQISTQTSTTDYIGVNFAYKEEVNQFYQCFLKCIESLKSQREIYRNSLATNSNIGSAANLSNHSIALSSSVSFDSNLNMLSQLTLSDSLTLPPPPTTLGTTTEQANGVFDINSLPPPPSAILSSTNQFPPPSTTTNLPLPSSGMPTPTLSSSNGYSPPTNHHQPINSTNGRPSGLLRTTSIPTNLNTEITVPPHSLTDIFTPNGAGGSAVKVITTTTTTINYASRAQTGNSDSFLKTARNVNKVRNSMDARKTLSKKDASTFTISLQNIEGLQNIAEALEEETLNLLDLVNEQVLTPTSSNVFLNQSITKVYEHLQILFILTGDSGQSHHGVPIIKSITERITKGPQEKEFSGNTVGNQWFNLDEVNSSVQGFHNLMYVKKNLIPTIAHLSTSVRVLGLQASLEVDWMSRNISSEIDKVVVQLAYLSRELIIAMSRLMAATLTYCRVNQSINQLKQDPSFSIAARVRSPSSAADLLNIWDELKIIKTPPTVPKEGVVKATLNQLILMITSENSYDSKFLKTFITTYQSFATPGLLLSKLIERFSVPEWYSAGVKSKILTIQQRVIVILKYWVENQSSDFDQDVIDQIYYFINNTLASLDGYQELAKSLTNLMDKVIKEREVKLELLFQMPPRLQFEEDGVISPIELFSEWSPQAIAQQLTLIDFQIFKEIEARELMSQNFNKQKLKWRSPTIMKMINRSTQFSFWVASVILMESKKEKRIKNFEKFCDVGKYLLKYNNLNSLMSLNAGLNLTPVHRLKKTKKKLSGSATQFLSDCEKLFSSKKSFKTYRDHLSSVSLPCIPYLGLILTDLVFIDEGNPDNYEQPAGSTLGPMVNFKKRELFYQSWTDLNHFKDTAYTYQPEEPLHTFLLQFPILDEKELYDLSLAIEPR